jgi:gentisate 1,2-dioxygenase
MATQLFRPVDQDYFSELAATPVTAAPTPWPALIVPRAAIDAEIGRLCDLKRQSGEYRAAEIVHPSSRGTVLGVSPALSVTIIVVLPGETIEIRRDNASRVEFCIRGAGAASIAGNTLPLERFNTWNVPSMTRRRYRNDGAEPLVWLSYSNAPLLERLSILYSDDIHTGPKKPDAARTEAEQKYVRETAPDYPILEDGARIRGYEFLTDIEVIENKPLMWPWELVHPHLSKVDGDGKRIIYLLYNPATGRRNGTTHSFFATITSYPRGKGQPVPKRGHRHSSYACNYHFLGTGESIVDGNHYAWEAGDFMLSAPSWSEHAHGSSTEGATVLTIQDHPFQIGVESLIWQEKADGPILTLGSEPGQAGYVGPRVTGD